jgi:polyphenol oxidase
LRSEHQPDCYYVLVRAQEPAKSPVTVLRNRPLARIPWLCHGFSTRLGGVSRVYGGHALNLGFTPPDGRSAVERNRAAFLGKLGALRSGRRWPLITLRQLHSDWIHCVTDVPPQQLAGDGLISATPGLLLAIQTADCLPIILIDTKRRAVGAFHAGWRGTLLRIAEKGVGEMRGCFGSQGRDLKAAIGPAIHGCCYQVGSEVREQFESQFAYATQLFREIKESEPSREKYPLLFLSARSPGHSPLPHKLFLDLVEANRRQLMAAGVPANHISASRLCTSCRNDLLFSHRAEKGASGRMMGVVGIRPSRQQDG